MLEEWRDVPGYEGLYEVSNLGQLRSVLRMQVVRNRWGNLAERRAPRTGRLRTLQLSARSEKNRVKGSIYLAANLRKDSKEKRLYIARLVLEAFIGFAPDGYTVNHKDGDKLNNCVSNLEWVTLKDNIRHANVNGLIKRARGEQNHSKLTEEQVRQIRQPVYVRGLLTKLAQQYGVALQTISAIRKGRKWRHSA